MEPSVTLVGTAHVVDLSSAIARVFGQVAPDAVALELDADRARVLFEPTPEGSRSRRRGVPLSFRLFARLERRLARSIGGGVAGAEMKAAWNEARARRLPVYLIDAPIGETVGRLLGELSVAERLRLLAIAAVGLLVPPRVVRRELGRYADDPAEYESELRVQQPALARILIDERNERMAAHLARLVESGARRLVAVVGDAHVPGLAEALAARGISVRPIRLAELATFRAS